MELDDETVWSTRSLDASNDFAAKCRVLCDENPNNQLHPLEGIINTLMTELWDHSFSQTEIRKALQSAIDDMPRYAAGEERRS